MTDQRYTLRVDDDVPVMRLLRAIASSGYRVSNIDGFTFRVHVPPAEAKGVDLAARRRMDEQTDAQIRDGMKAIFGQSDPPGAA